MVQGKFIIAVVAPLDDEGHVGTKGIPNTFVDSLTHDSVIVQIPQLHGYITNRLDMVLSILDQTHRDEDDNRILRIFARVRAKDYQQSRT